MIFLKRDWKVLLIVFLLFTGGSFLTSCAGYVVPPANQPPVAVITANPTSSDTPPLTVQFDGSRSYDPDGSIFSYSWDFGDGASGDGITVSHVYIKAGTFTATLTVTDNGGATGTASVIIVIRCDVIHEGDLVISGTEVFTIENQIYCLNGRILIKDSAQLIVQNATLILQLPSRQEWWISIDDQAHWIVNNVLLKSNYQFAIGFSGESKGDLTNVTFSTFGEPRPAIYASADSSITIKKSTIGNLFAFGQSTSVVEDSSIDGLLLAFEKNATDSLQNLKPGFIPSWNHQNYPRIQLLSTTVAFWGVLLSYDVAQLVILDSEIAHVELSIQYGAHVLDGFNPTLYAFWQFGGLTLNNTSIGFWNIALEDVTSATIINSEIRLLLKRDVGTIFVSDSIITGWWNQGCHGSITFEQVNIDREIVASNSILTLQGKVAFTNEVHVTKWDTSTITREFSALVQDPSGTPLSNINLELYSPQGDLIWSGTSNPEGKATFEIVFDDNNYDRTWTLKAPALGVENEVRFLIDTPIVIISPT